MEDQNIKKKILIVEDEPTLSSVLKARFEKEGIEIDQAKDGVEALMLLKQKKYDLVLLDIILPKMSGFEVMESLKNDPNASSIPIVIVSNLGQESDVQKGEMLGAIGYFIKAKLSIEELVSKVKEFFAENENFN
jgi:DNA-binding response OmpR family regulator